MKKNTYSLGLDIGIGSLGWALVDLNGKNVINKGVRIFSTAEDATDRRMKRGARRTNQRRKKRLNQIQTLLLQHNFPIPSKGDSDVWQYRAEGLDRLLTDEEFVSVLFHLAKRRGYQSNRRTEEDEEGKVTLEAIRANIDLMSEKKYRTIGEMIYCDPKFDQQKRNRDGRYLSNAYRSDLRFEIQAIFEAQRSLGNPKTSLELEEAYLLIWGKQLPFSTLEQIHDKVGTCELEPDEKRAPKASYTFQYFRLLNTLNNLRIQGDDVYRNLELNEKEHLISTCMSRQTTSFHQLRKDLESFGTMQEQERFAGLLYDPDKAIKTIEKQTFVSMQDYLKLRQAVGSHYTSEDFDVFGYAITYLKTEQQLQDYLKNHYRHTATKEFIPNATETAYPDDVIQALKPFNGSGFGSFSIKAMKQLLPHLEKGLMLHEAIDKAGYQKQQETIKPNSIPPIDNTLGNRVVIRALTQTRRVVNSIIKTYGLPERINIEFARDLKMDENDRKKQQRTQNQNRTQNETILKEIISKQRVQNTTGHDIVKYKLWKKQNGLCVYSGKPIDVKDVFDRTTEVDHIIPYSRSLDDSYHNRVLVLSKENQNKRNRLPKEYMSYNQWMAFVERINAVFSHLSPKKREHLLKESFTKAESDDWKARHLNDTAYIAKAFKKLLMDNLDTDVYATNGRITSILRKKWGFTKIREHSHTHHALDAAIIAVTNMHMIEQLSHYHKQKRNHKKAKFPRPWKGFADDLLLALNDTVVSRMPDRSTKGKLHEEQIRKHVETHDDGKHGTAISKPLSSISIDQNGDFPMYGKEFAASTYNAIKDGYLQYVDDLKKYDALSAKEKKRVLKPQLFESPVYVDGTPVYRVKVTEISGRVREINDGNGIVFNGEMLRVDLFQKDGKGHAVPVYKIDATEETLPDRAIVARKGYDQWTKIDETFDFMFSLYRNDLVQVTFSKPTQIPLRSGDKMTYQQGESVLLYYKSTHSANGSLEFDLMDGSNAKRITLSLKSNPPIMKKMNIDPIGRMTTIHAEQRQSFKKKPTKNKKQLIHS